MLKSCVTHAVGIASALADRQVHTCKDLAGTCGISHAYAEQLVTKLRKAEIVTAQRGPGGGYRLAKTPNEISVKDVVDAVTKIPERRYPLHARLNVTLYHTSLAALTQEAAL